MSNPVSFLDLQEAIQGVSTKFSTPISASNVQYVDSNNAVTTDLSAPVGGRFVVNGTDFVPGGAYVFFSHNEVQETVSAPAKYVSNTQLVVEYTPDMGTDIKTVQPIVMGGGGMAVSDGYLEYNGSFRVDESDLVAWNGDAFTLDLNTLVSGSSNTTFSVSTSSANITWTSNGLVSGNIVMANSVTQSQTLSTTIRDETGKSTTVKDIPLVFLGSDYTFLRKYHDFSVFIQFDVLRKTFGLFTESKLALASSNSPSIGGLRLSGSLSGRKIISITGNDASATFAITDDGHIHGRGSQTALSANVSNWNNESISTSCHLGLGLEKVSITDFVDFTETYGWPLCREVNAAGLTYMYLTQSGKIYGWGYGVINQHGTYGTRYYIPDLISRTYSPSTTYYTQGTPTGLVTPPPSPIIGMTKDYNNEMFVAWSKNKVYLQGLSANNNYGSNSTVVYHNNWQMTPTLRDLSNDNHNNGNTVESIRNKEILHCVVTNFQYATRCLWILATDGTLHLRYSRYYRPYWSPTDTDGYNGAYDPYMTNNQTSIFYCIQNTYSALGGRTFTKLDCGYYHFAALSNNGELVTWGSQSSGQCGVNSTSGSYATVINANGSLAGKQVSDFVCFGYTTIIKDVSGGLHLCGQVPTQLWSVFGVSSATNYLVPTAFPLKN